MGGLHHHPGPGREALPARRGHGKGRCRRLRDEGSSELTFRGTLSKDGRTVSGNYSQGGVVLPFTLAWKGEAVLEPAAKSTPITADVAGTWEGTLDVNGTSLRLVTTLTNHEDGATGKLVSVNQGGVELPDRDDRAGRPTTSRSPSARWALSTRGRPEEWAARGHLETGSGEPSPRLQAQELMARGCHVAIRVSPPTYLQWRPIPRRPHRESGAMKYMLIMNSPRDGYDQYMKWPRKILEANAAFMHAFTEKLSASGELVGTAGLAAPDQAKLVRAGKDGKPITDGVFAESKEFLAGYWIVDVDESRTRVRDRRGGVQAPGGPVTAADGTPIEHFWIEVRESWAATRTLDDVRRRRTWTSNPCCASSRRTCLARWSGDFATSPRPRTPSRKR